MKERILEEADPLFLQVEPASATSEYEKSSEPSKRISNGSRPNGWLGKHSTGPDNHLLVYSLSTTSAFSTTTLQRSPCIAKGDAMLMLRCGSDERPN